MTMSIKHLKNRFALARVYYEDGAPFSAARVLRQLADKLDNEGKERLEWLEGQQKNLSPQTIAECDCETEEDCRNAGECIAAAKMRCCEVCGGDCASANPPVSSCPMKKLTKTE